MPFPLISNRQPGCFGWRSQAFVAQALMGASVVWAVLCCVSTVGTAVYAAREVFTQSFRPQDLCALIEPRFQVRRIYKRVSSNGGTAYCVKTRLHSCALESRAAFAVQTLRSWMGLLWYGGRETPAWVMVSGHWRPACWPPRRRNWR